MLNLITLTGDRQWAFDLCEQYMARQTIKWGRWIVVDDGKEPTKCSLDQVYLRLDPGLSPRESFRQNMLNALTRLGNLGRSNKRQPEDRVLFIEDDDWYSRWHIENVNSYLDRASIAGECHAKYYNVYHRKYYVHPNTSHASLCQTGFKGEDVRRLALNYLESTHFPEQLDGHLWRRAGIVDSIKKLGPTSTTAVGIKGMPGRGGLGIHHGELPPEYEDDLDMTTLRLWLSDDSKHYEAYYQEPVVTVSEPTGADVLGGCNNANN